MYQKLFNLKKSFIFRNHAIADAKYEATRAVFRMTSRIQRHSDAALHRNCRISFFILLYSLLYQVVLSPVVHAPSGNPNKLPPDSSPGLGRLQLLPKWSLPQRTFPGMSRELCLQTQQLSRSSNHCQMNTLSKNELL